MNKIAFTIKEEFQKELTRNILPYWMNQMTDENHGGFYGRITGNEVLMPEAEKGAVLNARILWAFTVYCNTTIIWQQPPEPNAI